MVSVAARTRPMRVAGRLMVSRAAPRRPADPTRPAANAACMLSARASRPLRREAFALTPRTTPLHMSHLALGARMIDFGGWGMPVYYAGINEEHRAVRSAAGVFDVSHMGQVEIAGPGAHAFLQRVLSNDLDRLADGQ